MFLRQILSKAVRDVAREIAPGIDSSPEIQQALDVVQSDRPDLGDYQCNVALRLAKPLKQQPRAIATQFAQRLEALLAGKAKVEIAGPGFINFRLLETFLVEHAGALDLANSARVERTAAPRKVLVDFGGPNIAKALHVGHLRPHLIGDALQRILRAYGEDVTTDIHMGDWGTPIGMIIAQLQNEQPALAFFAAQAASYPDSFPLTIEGLNELYKRSKQSFDTSDAFRNQAREATEALQGGRHAGYLALWRHLRDMSLADVKRIYGRLGITFDLWLGESDVNDLLEPMLSELQANGTVEISDGAAVITAAKLGLPADGPPLILRKRDGAYTYAATDLATIKARVAMGMQLVLYVVDNRQRQHFEMVFPAARLAGYAPANVGLEHIGHGTINGPDGRPFKTRSGDAASLTDALDIAYQKAREELPVPGEQGTTAAEIDQLAWEIGVAAIKFQELRNSRVTDYVFDVDAFTRFEGKTGPYLQYAAVRANAILEKVTAQGIAAGPLAITLPAERDLLLHLCRLGEAIEASYQAREPVVMAEHAYQLVQRFGTFYTAAPVLQETDARLQASRVSLVMATGLQLRFVLGLLNIDVPERMLRREVGSS